MRSNFYIISFILIISFFILFSCQWQDPYTGYNGTDLLKNLDMSTDFTKEIGLFLDPTSEAPPSSESQAYYLYIPNIVSYDTFESSTGVGDFGNWVASATPPQTYEVLTGTAMYGNKYLHLFLDRSSTAQYFYQVFTSAASQDYVFLFDYEIIQGLHVQVSFGDGNLDTIKSSIPGDIGEKTKARFDISTFSSSNNFQIRFGYAQNTGDSEGCEVYIDNIALFPKNANSINKRLYIDGSSTAKFNDNTGFTFYEGNYKLEIYAKSDTSSQLTLKLGNNYINENLTSNWVKYSVNSKVVKTSDYLLIEVLPVNNNEIDRFPGGIYIARPHLYFLYN